MMAEVTRLDVVRAARGPRLHTVETAERYVAFAEEAMALVVETEDRETRRAVCRISEAWLALAEAQLGR